MKRAALYARVSTEQQVDKDSIPAQVDALKKYAREHNYEVQDVYVDDGISGTLLNERDELQRLLENVKKRKVDIILICKLDRWFRSVKHYMNTQEILDQYGVPWKAIWENYETESPSGRLMVTQMLAFAEFEAGNTALRINKTFDYKKTQHEVLSGKVPYGYVIKDKHMIPDPEKAEIARQVFQTYIDTGSMCETMRLTQGHGLPKTQRAFKMMLQNEKYLGKAYGYDDYCEPIIDKQTFETVQQMLSRNIKKNQIYNYIFSGLVYCADCGKRMTGTTDEYHQKKRRYKVYRCMYHFRPLPTCGNSKGINETKIEKYLVENLKHLAFEDVKAEDRRKADNYKKQIANLERKMSRLKELYVNELINLDEYKHDMTDYKAQIEDFRSRLEKYEGTDKTALKNLLNTNLADWYWTLTEDEKRTLWRSVIDKIWYGSDKKLRVDFR